MGVFKTSNFIFLKQVWESDPKGHICVCFYGSHSLSSSPALPSSIFVERCSGQTNANRSLHLMLKCAKTPTAEETRESGMQSCRCKRRLLYHLEKPTPNRGAGDDPTVVPTGCFPLPPCGLSRGQHCICNNSTGSHGMIFHISCHLRTFKWRCRGLKFLPAKHMFSLSPPVNNANIGLIIMAYLAGLL